MRGPAWLTATLGYVETLAALCRRLSREAVKTESRLAADWQNMLSMELSFDVMEQAADLTRQYRLQGADAVHLAVALHLRSLLGGVEEKSFSLPPTVNCSRLPRMRD